MNIQEKIEKYVLDSRGFIPAKRANVKWFENNGVSDVLDEIVSLTPSIENITNKIRLVYYNGGEKCSFCKIKPSSEASDNIKDKKFLCSTCARKIGNAKQSESFKKTYSKGEVLEKRKSTSFDRYGVDHPAKSDVVKEKIKNTSLEKYGVESFLSTRKGKKNFVSDDARRKISEKRTKRYYDSLNDNQKFLYDNPNTFYEKYKECGSLDAFMKQTGIDCRTAARYLDKNGYQQIQTNLSVSENVFAKSLNCDFISSDRKVLSGKEIDIWIPEHNLGVEYHGLYWHSSKYKNANYHKEKYELSRKAGITLLQFWSSEVEDKKDIVLSIVGNHLGKSKKIFARKTILKEISSREHSDFCDKNHLQGKVGASVKLGLFYEGVLVSVMSFGKSRFDKKHEWEMIRYCSLLGFNIVGGASKLWKYFLKTYDPSSVVTYADARISQGSLYEKLGFTFKHHSAPNFWYTKDFINLESRIKYQKHNLKDLLENFDENLTAEKNMRNAGFCKIYDAGNLVFVYDK